MNLFRLKTKKRHNKIRFSRWELRVESVLCEVKNEYFQPRLRNYARKKFICEGFLTFAKTEKRERITMSDGFPELSSFFLSFGRFFSFVIFWVLENVIGEPVRGSAKLTNNVLLLLWRVVVLWRQKRWVKFLSDPKIKYGAFLKIMGFFQKFTAYINSQN